MRTGNDHDEAAGAAHHVPVDPPSLSVVIPTHGRPDRVLAIAQAVLQEPVHEVVVAVDGPDQHLERALRAVDDPRLVVVVLPANGGPAAAREAGARAATGDVLLLIDDDVELCPGAVAGHARAHAGRDDLLVVAHNPVALPRRRRPGMAATYVYADEYDRAWREVLLRPETLLQRLWAGHLSVGRRAFLSALGEGWPVRYHEDQDLGLRLQAAGLTGRAEPSLRSRHHHARDTAAAIEESRRQGEAMALRAVRWPELPWPDYVVRPGPWGLLDRLSWPRTAAVVVPCCRALVILAGALHLWALETAALRLARQVTLRRSLRAHCAPYTARPSASV